MSFEVADVERIADAVLYEGYMLYPYRPSALKNRQRWTFGGVYPRAYSEAQGGWDAWNMQTECLVVGDQNATLDIRVRFLRLQQRIVGELDHPLPDLADGVEPAFRRVESLRVGERVFHTWQEAVEQESDLSNLVVDDLAQRRHRSNFEFKHGRTIEPLRNPDGDVAGVLFREQQALQGAIEVAAEQTDDRLYKVTMQVINRTVLDDAASLSRDDALLYAFVSTHAILGVQGGEFVSMIDPPEAYREIAATCSNLGTYPVLVGEEGRRDLLLSSPIILYDYPQIAPESAGDLFDSTEIDEILILRILTLTDEEKREMRESDERGRALLDRIEALPPEALVQLHGTMRNLQPSRDTL